VHGYTVSDALTGNKLLGAAGDDTANGWLYAQHARWLRGADGVEHDKHAGRLA
jgi:hypothetical protein